MSYLAAKINFGIFAAFYVEDYPFCPKKAKTVWVIRQMKSGQPIHGKIHSEELTLRKTTIILYQNPSLGIKYTISFHLISVINLWWNF